MKKILILLFLITLGYGGYWVYENTTPSFTVNNKRYQLVNSDCDGKKDVCFNTYAIPDNAGSLENGYYELAYIRNQNDFHQYTKNLTAQTGIKNHVLFFNAPIEQKEDYDIVELYQLKHEGLVFYAIENNTKVMKNPNGNGTISFGYVMHYTEKLSGKQSDKLGDKHDQLKKDKTLLNNLNAVKKIPKVYDKPLDKLRY